MQTIEDTILKLSCKDINHILQSNGLSLEAIGMFIILSDIYKESYFKFSQTLSLSFKKRYSENDITEAIDELIDRNYIEIVG